MRRRGRIGRTAALGLAAVALAAAGTPASAARYVTPTGLGTACTQLSPCDIVTGIESAPAGDEVVIGAGTYGSDAAPVDAALEFPAAGSITVRGADIGPGRPVIHVGSHLMVRGASSLLSDVEVRNDAAVLRLEGGRADRVIARQSPGSQALTDACQLEGSAVISNSVCIRDGGAGGSALSMIGASSARNVTGISTGTGMLFLTLIGTPNTGTAANSIVQAALTDIALDTGAKPALANDYAEALVPASTTVPGLVSSGLALRGAADLRQGPASATIDRGSAIAALGPLDLNGNVRSVGAAPDIGAYEHVPPPLAAAGTVVPASTGATITPQVTTGGGRTSMLVQWGTAPGVFTGAQARLVEASLQPSAPAVALSGLLSGTTYHYRVTVVSDGGVGTADGSFTTVSPPAAEPAAATAVTTTAAMLNGTVDTRGGSGTAHFEYAPAAGGEAAITPELALEPAPGPRAVSAAVTGLSPNTAYTVTVVVTNGAGTTRSAAGSFTTLAPRPAAGAGTAAAAGPNGAVLTSSVDTNGQAGTVHFELTSARGGATIVTPEQTLAPAAGPRRVRARVNSLRGSTAYRATVVVTTAGGTSRGDAGSFTTPRDRARPVIAIRSLTPVRMARRAAITPRVVCNEPCSIRAVATVGTRPGGRFRPLARARVAVRLTPVRGTRAADTDVRIDLTRARRLLVGAFDARRRVVVRLQITATDSSRNRRVVVRFIPVRRR